MVGSGTLDVELGSVDDGSVVDVAGSVLGGDELVVGDDVVVVSGDVVVGTSAGGSGGSTSTTVVVVAAGGRRFLRGAVVGGTVSGAVDATGGSVIATVVESSMGTDVSATEVEGAMAISGTVGSGKVEDGEDGSGCGSMIVGRTAEP